MLRRFLTIIILCTIVAIPYLSSAEESEEIDMNVVTEREEVDVDIRAVPPILDPEYRHKKKNQVELNINGGAFLGNSLGQTWIAGAKATYWINNVVGIGVNYAYTRLLTNSGSPFGNVLTNNNMHVINPQIVLSQDAAVRAAKSVMELDFYMAFGAGVMRLNGTWEPMGEIGGGVKFYTGIPWLAWRIDIDNFLHKTPQPGKDSFDFDVTFTGGVSFLFPSKASAYEK